MNKMSDITTPIPVLNTDKIVAVSPIIRRVEALEFADPVIPGEIKIDKHGKLLKSYFELENKVGSLIETYDNWVTHTLKKQLASRKLIIPKGENTPEREVTILNPVFIKPGISTTNNVRTPLLPTMARNSGYTYAAELYVDFVLNAGTMQEEILPQKFFGKIPVMLGSVLCHLRGKSERELIDVGECPKDPQGYFIIKGAEKVILIQEKLRTNKIFIYNSSSKGDVVCKMTCATVLGSTNVSIVQGKSNGLEIHLPFMGRGDQSSKVGNTMSVFQIYRMLGVANPQKMLDMILMFTKPEYRKKILVQLQASLIELTKIGDDIEYISSKKGLGDIGYEIRKSSITNDLKNELFPHISPDNITRKLYMLSIMIIRFSEYLIGVRNLDDRDNWGNKRLESAGRSLEQLFTSIFKEVIIRGQDAINKGRHNLQAVYRGLHPTFITDNFVSSFTANNWGVQGSFMTKENITDALKRESHLSVFSHLTKINTPISRKGKQTKIRLVQMSQLGFICSIETPEGGQCGLVKNAALTLYISLERNGNIVLENIGKYISATLTEQFSTPFLLNGQFMGWVEGETLRNYAISLRRTSTLSKDTAIVLSDGFLYIYTDAARPTRPLLIIDPSNNELVIKNKGLWDADMQMLLDEGCVEYIDAFEQEYIQLAQTMDDIDLRKANIEEALENQQEAVSKLSLLEAQLKLSEGFEKLDLEESIDSAKELVSQAADALKELQDIKPYTHAELDPTAIMGIAASIIPLPNHNPGPRNTYQCQPVWTPVLRPSSVRTKLGDLKDGDTVITIDPVTLKMSETKIHSHFVVDSTLASKTMLEFKTHSGRVVQSTHDHPFLTVQGWVKAEDLKTEQHHLCIYPSVKYLDDTRTSDDIIINVKSAKELLLKVGVKNTLVDSHTSTLIDMGLLPLKENNDELPIIARIMGFMRADGHINTTKGGNNMRTRMTFGQEYDAELFNSDVESLGFQSNKIQERLDVFKHPDGSTKTTHHVWVVDKWGAFASLFAIVGCVLGKKTETYSNPIPSWIMNGSDRVKREYLSGFMGGDGCKITRFTDNKKDGCYMARIVQHKAKKYLESSLEWFKQLVVLFNHFDIDVRDVTHKIAYEDKYKVELGMCSDRDTLIKYMDTIGYSYATTKYSDSLKVVEWLKYVANTIDKTRNFRKKIHDMHHLEKYTHPKLAKMFNMSVSRSEELCRSYRKNKGVNLPAGSIRLEEWMNYVSSTKNCIFVPIESIKEIEGCMVSDFTTVSETHSFVSADGFITHNCSMGGQALGIYNSQHAGRFDTTAKCLAYPSRPLFETQMNEILGLNELPAGSMVTLAIMSYTGYNQEDAIIMNKASIDRGLFRQVVYKTYKTEQKRTKLTSEEFGRPEVRKGESPEKYAAINEKGIAQIGSFVRTGDCIIGKVRINNVTKKITNASIYIGVGMEGIVDKVLVATNPAGKRIIKVKIRQIRKPIIGDKFASRHAQKSTVGLILAEEDMPYTSEGVRPDIIINPHAIPSRMTIAKLIEIVASKIAVFSGERVNATAFRRFNIKDFKENLTQYGYASSGKERMFSGFTGKPLEAQIFIGPCYYQVLKHHVLDKVQVRSQGGIKQLSHQPTGGRAHEGGQRVGEMERDAIISHGASSFLKERLCGVSDAYESVRCIKCGITATANQVSDKYTCRGCGDDATFGKIVTPYAFKLMEQMLACPGFRLHFKMKVVE